MPGLNWDKARVVKSVGMFKRHGAQAGFRRAAGRLTGLLAGVAALLLWAGPLLAEPIYVSDVQEITMRTGPGVDNKVVQTLRSGARIEKLREEGEWALIRAENGREGWVLKRYLSADIPSKVQFEEYRTRNAELIEKAGRIEAIIGKHEEESRQQARNLAALQAENTRLKQEYDLLSQANANVAELAKRHQDLKAANEATRQEAEKLARENQSLRDISDVKWFVAGAGVFFGGWVFGYLIGRSVRKKSNRMYV